MHLTPGLNDDGSSATIIALLESIAGFDIPGYDYVGFGYPDAITVVVTFKVGGAGGATVGTLTLVYTDSTQNFLSSVTKS